MGFLRSYGSTNFVTTLRAIAATMVVIIHTGAFADFGTVGRNITEAGRHGVEIFFVISGFSIATTWARSKDYRDFFIRRIFRILPLYWLIITLAFFMTRSGWLPHNGWVEYFNADLSAYNYLMHIAGLIFFDPTIANTILGVEWTIPIELFWYAALPAIMTWANSEKQFVATFLWSIVGVAATKGIAYLLVENSPGLFAKWFPTSYGPFFLVGVMACRWRHAPSEWMHKHADQILLISAVSFVTFTLAGLPALNLVASIATSMVISLFDTGRLPRVTAVIEFKPFLYIGTVSYSLYLLHFPIALFLMDRFQMKHGLSLFFATYVSSIAASSAFFFLVERPTNAFGKRLADRRE
jgi:exopolysaccharide production protein ExoZ